MEKKSSRKIMGSSWSSGWWLSPTPLKNDGVKVSWDDCSIPKMMGKYMGHCGNWLVINGNWLVINGNWVAINGNWLAINPNTAILVTDW